MSVHLWFNGDDHAPGETEADATAFMQRTCGISDEDAAWAEWTMVPDDSEIRDEDGQQLDPPVTAAEYAASILALEKVGVVGG
jgi:hypothetical protein